MRRSKLLPKGGSLDPLELAPLVEKVRDCLIFARSVREVQLDEDARAIWREVYPNLSEGKRGLVGAITARAEAQVLRLALVYALLDRSNVIQPPHLRAALALWEYVEASVEYIFGNKLGDPIADTILRALRLQHEGLTRTEIRDLFKRHETSHRIDTALETLAKSEKARMSSESTGGRPTERWFARL